VVERARERARELGLTDERVFFVDGWVPYAERGGYLLDADVGVSTHRDTLETSFAFRTRILDYLWAGLPVLCSDGDAFAELVREHAVGDVVPVGDASALADAMRRMCSPHARAEAADRSSALGETYRWDTVLRPVVEFCRAPQPAAGRAEASRMLKTALSSNQHAAWTTRAVRKSRRLLRAAAHRGR
jgi:glycosyltransferase involved in cell wall biosynthesis